MATGLREPLPPGCHLGVTQDGRVFFVNDREQLTSWLHPVTGQPALTGLQFSADLPPGWEHDITNDGRVYFVDHNRCLTTFDHPLYGPSDPARSSARTTAVTQQSPNWTYDKEHFKRGDAAQRSVKAPTAKRNPNSEVVKGGWLYRLESSGISKIWKRRWCILADFALFVYKNDDEAVTLTSILLPSYRINPCTEADNIKRNFVFKVEHENTKTLYFATDQQTDLTSWMSLLRQAAMMNGNASFNREQNNNVKQHTMNKVPQDGFQGGSQFAPPSNPNIYHKDQPYQRERPTSYESGPNVGRPSTNQEPSYKGYGDHPSPFSPPTNPSIPTGYDNPIYSSHVFVQPRQSFTSQNGPNRNSLTDPASRVLQAHPSLNRGVQIDPQSNRGIQAHPLSNRGVPVDPASNREPNVQAHPLSNRGVPVDPASNRGPNVHPHSSRDNSFNSNQAHTSSTFPENSGSFRTHPHQQGIVRDGLVLDPARNSLANSDSSHSGRLYQHAQGENQQARHPPGSRGVPQQQQRDAAARDSYSETNDNRIKQLNRWDQNFPSLDEDHLKHGSFDDLLDGGTGRHPGKSSTFNARSKSHENFSQFPNARFQQQHQTPGGHPQGHLQKNNLGQSQSINQHSPSDGRLQGPGEGQGYPRPTAREGPGRSFASSQGSSQHIPPYQPQREFQRQLQQPSQARDPQGSLRDTRDPRLQQDQPQQRDSLVSSSSMGIAREPVSHSLLSNQHVPPQPPLRQSLQHDPRQQPPQQGSLPRSQQGSLPRSHQAPHQTRPDLHLSFGAPSQNPHSLHNQNSPHIYVNLPSRNSQSQYSHSDSQNSTSPMPLPARPPYPPSVRQQIVEEMAQTETPSTQRDFRTSNQMNIQRMQQPPYFQYPSPRDQQNNQNSLDQRSAPPHHQPVQTSQTQADPRASGISHTVKPPWDNREDGPQSPDASFSRTNMMDPEAQQLRFAYERVHSLRMAPDKAPPKRQPAYIETVKEDPNMSDRDVLETNLEKIAKKHPLSGPRLRMSISAGDLIGKTHDELVLLLIQLRRNQAGLEKARDVHRSRIDQLRSAEMEYRRQMPQYGRVDDKLMDQHQAYVEVKGHMEEIENKLEVYKPIINLLDNMVTMGSLYGGDNLMLATQYRKHLLRPDQYQPPKKMLEFSRKNQEERLIQKTEEEIKQLSSDEVDLEEKIDRLNELDRRLQEQSVRVSSFREDKELMEKALNGVLKQQDVSRNDPREMGRLSHQQRMLEKEISRVTQQLAEASKELEETTAENSKLEYEVALLRNKVNGELPRSRSVPSLASQNVQTKMKMEKELAKVEGIMQGLSKEGARLSQAMSTIRRSSSSSQLASALDAEDGRKKTSTYLQTDIDSGEQTDLSKSRERTPTEGHNSVPAVSHQRQNANAPEGWDVENADENTKRFFGLVPKEKPKTLTVRDVKRQSEQRKEREKGKNDEDVYANGEEIKLRVSNVDNETSSIIHARIPSDPSGQVAGPGQWGQGHPFYENLRYSVTAVPETHSAPGSRRSSLILMAPKPFTPYQDKTARPFRSELELSSAVEPPFHASFAASNSEAPPVMDRLDRHRSTEILNSQPNNGMQMTSDIRGGHPYVNGKLAGIVGSGEDNPYGNNYSINSFGSQDQVAPVKFMTQPSLFHTRSQSDITDQPGLGDIMKPSHQESYKPSAVDDNTWKGQDVDPPASAFHITRPVNFLTYQPSRAYTARPWSKPSTELSSGIFNVKRSPKGRYLTISSSEPLKMERNTLLNQTIHSTAGDLILSRPIDDVPDIIKSSQSKVDQIDDETIDREILYVPEKVFIPERYDAEADAEHLTEDEKLTRSEKAERIKRLLASQSVLSMSQTDVSQLDQNVHSRVQQEQRERAHFLTLNQELARQVTLQSKKQAAERRKTWSGAQFADAKRQYEEGLLDYPT